MSLIKASSPIAGRAAGFRSRAAVSARADADAEAPPGQDPRDLTVQRLTARVGELETALAAAREDHDVGCKAARELGREEGRRDAEILDRERLDALDTSLRKAVEGLADQICAKRDIAIDLARAALERLFADPSLYHGMVAETAHRQASAMARGTIIGLRVSAADFPDQAALAALPSLGANVRVEADASLASGACLFDLTLGSLDASLPRQAAVIESVFAQTERKAASA